MTVSKDFLQKRIEEANKNKDECNTNNDQKSLLYQGMIMAYQECFSELIKPPEKKEKVMDTNKTYESILMYYINKGYTKEHANDIAMEAIKNQKQKVLQ